MNETRLQIIAKCVPNFTDKQYLPGVSLAQYDSTTPKDGFLFKTRVWHGTDQKNVLECAMADMRTGCWAYIEAWHEGAEICVWLNQKRKKAKTPKRKPHHGKYYAFVNTATHEICQFWDTSKRQCRKRLIQWGDKPTDWKKMTAAEADEFEQSAQALCRKGGKQ